MNDDQLLQELDRNMDTVFDNLYVLNELAMALTASLPRGLAARALPKLDQALDDLPKGKNPPGETAQLLLYTWRNQTAARVGAPVRPLGK